MCGLGFLRGSGGHCRLSGSLSVKKSEGREGEREGGREEQDQQELKEAALLLPTFVTSCQPIPALPLLGAGRRKHCEVTLPPSLPSFLLTCRQPIPAFPLLGAGRRHHGKIRSISRFNLLVIQLPQ